MKLGIFTSFDNGQELYEKSCQDLGVDYEVVDILSSDWIDNVLQADCDGFLCSSTSDFQERKTILDERYYFISHILNKKIYPSFTELYIHESKRNMAAWLEISGFPHPRTHVFADRKEALAFFESTSYPLVLKSNVGSHASRVVIVKSKAKAKRITKKVFPGAHFQKLKIGWIFFTKVFGMKIYPDLAAPQKFYLIAQDFKDIIHEWRIIKIGESYFGHQKLLKGEFASGSGRVGWVAPPKELLLLVKNICDRGHFVSMAVDVFETKEGEYFINELQSSFGSYLDSQMYIDGKPGRFKLIDGAFVFEEGFFNVHGSRKLRVEHFVQLLEKQDK